MKKFEEFEKEINKDLDELTKDDSPIIKDAVKSIYHRYLMKFMFYLGWLFSFKFVIVSTLMLEAAIIITSIFGIHIPATTLFIPFAWYIISNISLFIALGIVVYLSYK